MSHPERPEETARIEAEKQRAMNTPIQDSEDERRALAAWGALASKHGNIAEIAAKLAELSALRDEKRHEVAMNGGGGRITCDEYERYVTDMYREAAAERDALRAGVREIIETADVMYADDATAGAVVRIARRLLPENR